MTDAFLHFMRGLLRMPLYAQLWVLLLLGLNGIAPLFYLSRVEAQVTLGVFLAGAALMVLITKKTGFSRLLGAGHFLWFILIAYLAPRLGAIPADDPYGLWLRALIAANAISLVIDVTDVVRYLRGDTAEMV